MNIPEELRYSSDHEWVKVEGERVRIGITDYAQDALGDVVFVQIPELGAKVTAGGGVSEVESTKSVSDIYAPVAGEVVEVNNDLETNPELAAAGGGAHARRGLAGLGHRLGHGSDVTGPDVGVR